MLYEHVGADGQVTERCRPVEASHNAAQLAAKAADPASGWREAGDPTPAEPGDTPDEPGPEKRRGRGTAAIAVAAGGA